MKTLKAIKKIWHKTSYYESVRRKRWGNLMKKTYIIYYEWPSTVGNHAGMAYLFRILKKWNNNKIRLIEMPTGNNSNIPKWLRERSNLYLHMLLVYLRIMTNKNDIIFFTEFLDGSMCLKQTSLAEKLRQNNVRAKLFGLVHLPEKMLLDLHGDETYIKEKLKLLDKIVVLGSSLGNYFSRLGFDKKVVTTFHYVENSYYKPIKEKEENLHLRVIAMGNLNRNFTDLKTIVVATPDIDYDICMGALHLENEFSNFNNVILHGILSESELLQLMQQADVGLSVLEDTVGSNVITTSLACGLAQIVSDVGSIRDYCDETNTIFCKSTDEFANALLKLNLDRNLVENMSRSALKQAERLSIKKFNEFFVELMSKKL